MSEFDDSKEEAVMIQNLRRQRNRKRTKDGMSFK
jgi:hypothetical protein